jgi:hypothetical protein
MSGDDEPTGLILEWRSLTCPHCREALYLEASSGDLVRCYGCGEPITIEDPDHEMIQEEELTWTRPSFQGLSG